MTAPLQLQRLPKRRKPAKTRAFFRLMAGACIASGVVLYALCAAYIAACAGFKVPFM